MELVDLAALGDDEGVAAELMHAARAQLTPSVVDTHLRTLTPDREV